MKAQNTERCEVRATKDSENIQNWCEADVSMTMVRQSLKGLKYILIAVHSLVSGPRKYIPWQTNSLVLSFSSIPIQAVAAGGSRLRAKRFLKHKTRTLDGSLEKVGDKSCTHSLGDVLRIAVASKPLFLDAARNKGPSHRNSRFAARIGNAWLPWRGP